MSDPTYPIRLQPGVLIPREHYIAVVRAGCHLEPHYGSAKEKASNHGPTFYQVVSVPDGMVTALGCDGVVFSLDPASIEVVGLDEAMSAVGKLAAVDGWPAVAQAIGTMVLPRKLYGPELAVSHLVDHGAGDVLDERVRMIQWLYNAGYSFSRVASAARHAWAGEWPATTEAGELLVEKARELLPTGWVDQPARS